MMPPLRSFDDVDGRERGQKKTDDLRAMTTLGPRTLQRILDKYIILGRCCGLGDEASIQISVHFISSEQLSLISL